MKSPNFYSPTANSSDFIDFATFQAPITQNIFLLSNNRLHIPNLEENDSRESKISPETRP